MRADLHDFLRGFLDFVSSMRIEFEPYEIPLRRPLPGSGETVRRGFYLKVDGAIGEVAPLPGWSRETLAEAEADLREIVAGKPWEEIRCASVWFGWECAEQERNGWRDFPALVDEVKINALGGDIESALAAGCRCFKIKVAGEPSKMAELVKAKAAEIRGRANLRLDANRAWNEAEALTFFDAIHGINYQYLEEPVNDSAALRRLIENPNVKIALDETLREISPEDLMSFVGVKAVVLKPTLLGGLAISRAFVQAAESIEAVSVVSSSFESPVGLRSLAKFAASLSKTPEPSGLDTASWFADESSAEFGNYRVRLGIAGRDTRD